MMVCIAGLLRTAALGGLVYVPVVDDHDTHDLFLTIYLMFTMAWFFGIIHLSDRKSQSRVYRKRVLRVVLCASHSARALLYAAPVLPGAGGAV